MSRITEVIRLSRGVVEMRDTKQSFRDDAEWVKAIDDLCAYLLAAFPDNPHEDDTIAFFEGLLIPRRDILNEDDLKFLGDELVPIAVLHNLIHFHKVAFQAMKAPHFLDVVKRWREVLSSKGSVEYQTFAEEEKNRRFADCEPIWWTRRGVDKVV